MRQSLCWVAVLPLILACERIPAQSVTAARENRPAAPEPASAQAPTAPPQNPVANAPVPPGSAPASAGAAKPVPEVLPEVIARVNGEPIERADLERAIRNIESQAGRKIPADRRNDVYRNVIEKLVDLKLLAQEARNRNVTVPDAELEAKITQFRNRFPSQDAFEKALLVQKTSVESMRDQARNDMLIAKVIETAVGSGVVVQDKDVTDFYTQNPERFAEGEAVRASHILIRVPPKTDAATQQRARARADAVLAKAKGGEDFAALARANSEDRQSAARGGELGYIHKGQMVPAFETAAFALQPGTLSEVVESPAGFHIIKATEHRGARTVPLAEAREQIRAFLTNRVVQQKTAALVSQLKAKSKVEILI